MESSINFLDSTSGALLMICTSYLSLFLMVVVFPVVAFFKDWRWGIACLLLPGPPTLVLSFMHFRQTKVVSLVTFGLLAASICIFLLRASLSTFFSPDIGP